MNDLHLGLLFLFLVILLMLSAFFSGSETGLMAINRYRLRHLARSGHRGATRVSRLLERPDRLIGLILLGNNFFNILASSLATIIAIRLMGEAGIALAALLLTIVLLIFGEVTPKTLAALHPERIAFPASVILAPLLKIFYPVVAGINAISNVLLKPLGISSDTATEQNLSVAELRTVVLEAGAMIPARHRKMLLSILDLEAITVDDIMVPRSEVEGVDLNEDWNEVMLQLKRAPYTRLVVYRDSIDHVVGFLHMRSVIGYLSRGSEFDREDLERLVEEPYFIPEGTQLQIQLLNFQQQQRRIGLVVDEYGDLQGLVTLEDILEEIVGEFTTDPQTYVRRNIRRQADGSYLVDASVTVRSLNRSLSWNLPIDGPKTLNGLIMEALETIPESGTRLELAGHPIEIVKIAGNKVKTVLIKSPVPEPVEQG
ncbi:MAG: HlyC/CorC family transporter [Candidatus Competibacteraceae bacterium]|nr:HlyC/CorC family transporter [Candidatus Competibacteraceae bacterium]MCB1812519.1 HlyC/CorC family transporter [Candidatus Competibacteraceae bacterium]